MITLKSKGDFSKVTQYLSKLKEASRMQVLEKYAQEGVSALSAATPVRSGVTASSWYYEIETSGSGATINYCNSNSNNGVNIAVILQYGHGTGTGGWVAGRDYINPAIQPVFDKIAEEAWKEVTSI